MGFEQLSGGERGCAAVERVAFAADGAQELLHALGGPLHREFAALEGIGGGGLAPVEQAILVDTFPAEKRASAFAVYSIAIVTAPAIGPTLGGWITDSFSWRWLFFI